MYCTVETIENGSRHCMAVPKTWVINNILYYPKTMSEIISARKIESKPEANWNLMECKILSDNIGNTFTYCLYKNKKYDIKYFSLNTNFS